MEGVLQGMSVVVEISFVLDNIVLRLFQVSLWNAQCVVIIIV